MQVTIPPLNFFWLSNEMLSAINLSELISWDYVAMTNFKRGVNNYE